MGKQIQVGKFTLESLTTGMYSDPKIVYREYIQNSVDSLEEAEQEGLILNHEMRINVIVDEEEEYISITDNGTGITAESARDILLNVGKSTKRQSNNRGFRGIGRLGGMSYCDELRFTTSAQDEEVRTVVSFDCKKLRNLLIPGENDDMSLSSVLMSVTTVNKELEEMSEHYFRVEMIGVSGFSDLLDIDAVEKYIMQVAPVPYDSTRFIYASELRQFAKKNGYRIEEFPIYIGTHTDILKPLLKPNKSRFHADRNKRKPDDIISMCYYGLTNGDELYAIGWYGICNWLGTISENEISGIRIRKGNILIGDNKTINSIFKEPRFNGWVQGELFVLSDKLIPNARRDDFEQNEAYYYLIEQLKENVGSEIAKLIREASMSRNDVSAKVLKDVEKTVEEANAILKDGFNSSVDKERLKTELEEKAETLKKTKVKAQLKNEKEELSNKIEEAIEEVSESNNYKLNQINSGIDRKSKKILSIVSDILSLKLSKFLVDEIIEEIVNELNGGKGK